MFTTELKKNMKTNNALEYLYFSTFESPAGDDVHPVTTFILLYLNSRTQLNLAAHTLWCGFIPPSKTIMYFVNIP